MKNTTQTTPAFMFWLTHDVTFLERAGIDVADVWASMRTKDWFEARVLADGLIYDMLEAGHES